MKNLEQQLPSLYENISNGVYLAQMSPQNQDYSGQNLRGRSFKGQNLEGVDFSYADIRSANFTGANLRGANFTGAKAGLQRRWVVFLVIISWLLSGLSGFLFWINGSLILSMLHYSRTDAQFMGWTALITTIIIFAVILREGIGTTAVAVATIMTVVRCNRLYRCDTHRSIHRRLGYYQSN